MPHLRAGPQPGRGKPSTGAGRGLSSRAVLWRGLRSTAGLGEREVDDEGEGDNGDHVAGNEHGLSGADECGGDKWCGATEDGDDDLVRETDACYPD